MHVAVIGNSGGGKSILARRLAARHDLPMTEIDRLLWRPGWARTPEGEFDAAHSETIAGDRSIIDGLGTLGSLAARLHRATAILHVDLPVWMHFWLATERQMSWDALTPQERPCGAVERPPTERLFRTIWEIHENWMPAIRKMVAPCEADGIAVHRIDDAAGLSAFDLPQRAVSGRIADN